MTEERAMAPGVSRGADTEEGSGSIFPLSFLLTEDLTPGAERRWIETLREMDAAQARRLIDRAYSRAKTRPNILFNRIEGKRFKELVKKGNSTLAVELLEEAYHRAKMRPTFLSDVDKRYLGLLQEIGANEAAGRFVERARRTFEKERKGEGRLLTKLDLEYLTCLRQAGQADTARRMIDLIYLKRRTEEEKLAELLG